MHHDSLILDLKMCAQCYVDDNGNISDFNMEQADLHNTMWSENGCHLKRSILCARTQTSWHEAMEALNFSQEFFCTKLKRKRWVSSSSPRTGPTQQAGSANMKRRRTRERTRSISPPGDKYSTRTKKNFLSSELQRSQQMIPHPQYQ